MTKHGDTKPLPADWMKRLSRVTSKLTMPQVGEILDLSESQLYNYRLTNQELDRKCLSLSRHAATKSVYNENRASIVTDNVDNRTLVPLIDKKNLELEMRMSVLYIVSLDSLALHSEKLHTVRRWGALLALAFDVITELKSEIRHLRSEVNNTKVQLHNKTRGTLSPTHAANGSAALAEGS